MVRIRLKRTGTRNAICFRVVVMEKRSSRDGRAIEELGYYNPRSKEESVNVDRYNYWVGVGAVPTETVRDIVDRAVKGVKLADRPRPASLSRKAKAKAEAAKQAEEAAKAEAAKQAEEAKKAAEAAKAEEAKVEEAPKAEEAPAEA